MIRGWTGCRAAVVALGLLASSAPRAVADNILTFSTAGAIETDGITGSGNVISFVPVQNNTADTTSNISLGYFQVAPLAPGQSTTYTNTPFQLTLVPSEFNSTAISSTPITLTGTINGTVTGTNLSTVDVTFNPGTVNLGPNISGSLTVTSNPDQLVPSTNNNGQTTLQGLATITSDAGGGGVGPENGVPEPSTIALFLSTVGGLGLRRLVHNRRRRAAA